LVLLPLPYRHSGLLPPLLSYLPKTLFNNTLKNAAGEFYGLVEPQATRGPKISAQRLLAI
jgi:hypothetical protein